MRRGMRQLVSVQLQGSDGETRTVRLPLALVARMMRNTNNGNPAAAVQEHLYDENNAGDDDDGSDDGDEDEAGDGDGGDEDDEDEDDDDDADDGDSDDDGDGV